MFHWKDNWFFGRLSDGSGSVRIMHWIKPPKAWPIADLGPQEDTDLDITIDAHSWASIVSSVSEIGEGGGRFYKALAFHGEPK